MRPPLPVPTLSRRARIVLGVIVALIVLIIVVASLAGVYVNWLWFGSVHYRFVYSSVLGTRVMLFFLFGVVMALIVAANLYIAFRSRPPFHPMSAEQHSLERYRVAIEPRRRLILISVAVFIGLLTGINSQGHWQMWMLWRNGTKFGTKDPQFHKDISYFAFTYPFQRYLVGFLFVAVVLSLLGALIVHYIFGALRIQTPGDKVLPAARAHLSVLIGVFVALKVIAYFLDRYGLVFSNRGGTTGASYTDVNAVLPIKTILMFVALICAVAFIANVFFRNFALPAIALVLLIFSSVLIGGAYPAIVQQFRVKPNANEKEAPYITRNINATRAAYGIGPDKVTYTQYPAVTSTGTETEQKIYKDTQTIPNARLLDPNILSPTFDQNQRILNYFAFGDKLDIDRYDVGGITQDYVLGVRELDPSKLTGNQTNWINKHLVYTHGNGFVAAPANEAPGGQPDYSAGEHDLPPTGNLTINQSRIYFGELFGDDYAIVGAKKGQAPREFDQPGVNGNDVKNVYNGGGGVRIGNFFNRFVFAAKYRERNILFSSAISSNSRILFVRDPRERVQKVAPFLKVDGDPYPAVVDGRIQWIVDGYTTSDGYPYAQRETLGDITKDSLTGRGTSGQPNQQVNYIRNSVKATVDAYTGKVTLYQFDKTDPVLKTWMKAFPNLVKPETAISADLRAHFRYPEDLFKVQRDLIASYHVSDPQQFFNSQNFWEVPSDPTQPGDQPQPPYYLLQQPPGSKPGTKAEFQLTSVLNALKRPNMAAYVSVSSDPQDYGKFRVLELPSDSSVLGPGQVQSTLRSTDQISKDVALFGSGQSNVLFGNLLTLPVAGGLLYVEPLYVEGQGSSYPQLRKVLVAFGSSVGYGDNMKAALKDLFSGDETNNSGNGNSTTPTPSSSPPSSVPSTSPPSSSSSSPPTAVPSNVAQAAEDAQKAFDHMQQEFLHGSAQDYQAAQQKLAEALSRLQALSGGTNVPSPSPTG
ncbi:MAG TPA: UPF0182 family protein [Mycobacteriales bacterium]|nr:UPF0182 family protein [Mycobacteriales bacterium]